MSMIRRAKTKEEIQQRMAQLAQNFLKDNF
jgi:hypothetical protein